MKRATHSTYTSVQHVVKRTREPWTRGGRTNESGACRAGCHRQLITGVSVKSKQHTYSLVRYPITQFMRNPAVKYVNLSAWGFFFLVMFSNIHSAQRGLTGMD